MSKRNDREDVLIFVEDPGAANCLAQLPAALKQRGWQTFLVAHGLAERYLPELGIQTDAGKSSLGALKLIEATQPRLVLVGTSDNFDSMGLMLVAEARRAGIQTIGIVDHRMNADIRFKGRSSDPMAYAPDWLLVPDEWTKATFVNLAYPARQIAVCGHPYYDYVRSVRTQLEPEDINDIRSRVLPDAVGGRKVVLFASECAARISPLNPQLRAGYTLTGSADAAGRTEIALEEFLFAIRCVTPRPYLILRLHPKDKVEYFEKYLKAFDFVSHGGLPLELIYVSDLVVGLTSMLLMEAALLGKMTLSIIPRPEEKEWVPGIELGVTMCVTTRNQLCHCLPVMMCGDPTDPAAVLDRVIPWRALERYVEFVENLLCKV